MAKSPDAFRTISEVADWLGIQAHVLRFWESKFTQVKPIKRAGGRRYYRPADMMLLGGIKQLLHEDGLTIKGVQKILREEGMSHVAEMSPPLDELTLQQIGEDTSVLQQAEVPVTIAEEPKGVVLSFETKSPEDDIKISTEDTDKKETSGQVQAMDEEAQSPANPAATPADDQPEAQSPAPPDVTDATPSAQDSAPPPPAVPDRSDSPAPPPPAAPQAPLAADDQSAKNPASEATPVAASGDTENAPQEGAETDRPRPTPEQTAAAAIPDFLRRPLTPEAPKASDNPPAAPEVSPPAEEQPPQAPVAVSQAAEPEPTPEPEAAPPAPKPRIIDGPPITPEDQIEASPAVLSAAFRAKRLTPDQARLAAPLLQRLTALRDSMAASRRGGASAGPKD
ncbi:MerR family transcriptional regulator [Sulfitobacter mediterraneus]|uniref:MerR family transcriptional regulator n=1 Tax=Sulfitobacter mediterraneus TaxID=83219 RepID=UPI001E5C09D4|nr:MerR family transcriptional regulator [Sulfitobacter mediterraneus]MCD2360137.1 MerR family transcriptional regulator [Sulfitobacter mediterraneus]